MLNSQQIEMYILGLLRDRDSLVASRIQQQAFINELQTTILELKTTIANLNSTGSGNNSIDSYPQGSGILHKLKHFFNIAPVFSSLTASKPMRTASDHSATTGYIDVSSEVVNTLPIGNGGTGATTAANARSSLSVAALPQTIQGSNFQNGAQSLTCSGSQSVTVTGSSFTAPAGGGACSGTFSFTIQGVNFTVSIPAVNCTGSQALV
jgi:hypothetical protein